MSALATIQGDVFLASEVVAITKDNDENILTVSLRTYGPEELSFEFAFDTESETVKAHSDAVLAWRAALSINSAMQKGN